MEKRLEVKKCIKQVRDQRNGVHALLQNEKS